MEENRNGKGCGGFTLIETLLVTAILVILLGLALVGVARYRDYLKITELDNEAREIFMAAENRAVLLENSGESVSLLGEKQEGMAAPIELSNRESSDGANLAALLPAGVIDPALRDGHFIILYDASTHHVKEVFYAEGDIDPDLDLFRQSRFERVSYYRGDTSSRRLVGWYSGGEAENIGTKPLPTPGVEVLIENGEELTLTVRYTMPEGLPTNVASAPSVKLECGGMEVDLLASARTPEINGAFGSTAGTTVTYKWVLDSLVKNSGGNSQQFRDLVSVGLGGSFTVTAGLKLKVDGDGYIDSAYYAQGTDNSLFAKKTDGGDTAYITNVRHLQNLCMDFSSVGAGITKAEQLTDIECGKYKNNQGEVLDPNYNFIPIANGALTSYDGKTKTISGLYVSCSGDAGLFGLVTKDITIERIRLLSPWIASSAAASIGGESNAAPLLARVDEGTCTLKNIEVIDGSAEGRTYVGGLVGVVNHKASCRLENCRVYWTEPKELVKSSGINYKISGKYAGGLIGYASGAASIEGSFAAATVKGDTGCGGLVGRTDTSSLTVSKSYADCYLTGNAGIGGLVGQSNTPPRLTDCYAAGFIMDPVDSLKTAGLVNGSEAAAKNCYSVVRVLIGGELEKPAVPLYGSADDGSDDVCYLFTAAEVTAGQFGSAFEYEKAKPETHVYNLLYRLNPADDPLTPPYPFPGLRDLPHYSDWAELPVIPAGLVYYETYSKTLHGAWGVLEDGTPLEMLQETPPIQDGYALAFKGGATPGKYTIKYGASDDQIWTLKKLTWTNGEHTQTVKTISVTKDGTSYTLVPLPDAIVTGALPDFSGAKFYQKLTCGTGTDTRTYWFNPHFAKTVKQQDDEPPNLGSTAASAVSVRTPRHFYDLSKFQESYVNNKRKYYFRQELDLDYAAYSWYGPNQPEAPNGGSGSTSYKQLPIGEGSSVSTRFSGTYDGGCHKIKNVFFNFTNTHNYLGLFGYIQQSGSLENIVYEMDPKSFENVTTSPEKTTHCGMLVGHLEGNKVENCAVYGVNAHITNVGALWTVGGLVGFNSVGRTVTGCSAELVSLKVSNAWAGGLVGTNSGIVSHSYAVGKIETIGPKVGGGGLINDNGDGTVEYCYAAVFLTVEDLEQKRGLCHKAGSITESGFFTGTFKYRGEVYNVDETYKGSGDRITPAELAEKISGLSEAYSTIHYGIPNNAPWRDDYVGDGKEAFPYRTGVKDADGQTVHYGLWPVEHMPPAGLAYYETYSDTITCVSGQYENTKIMTLREDTKQPGVTKDGYALVFKGDIPICDYSVKYGESKFQQSWTLNKSAEGEYAWKDAEGKEKKVEPIEADGYTLIPLPDKIVTGELPGGDVTSQTFYQKLIYGDRMFNTRTFYFNPHFAGRIKAGELVSVEGGSVKPNAAYTAPATAPAEPVNTESSSVAVWASLYEDIEAVWKKNAIAVRTARHFYALSCFQNTYVVEPASGAKKYYFEQALNLDYNSYAWYGDEIPEENTTYGYYVQAPIGQGTQDSDGFKGAYNGGGHTIENVFYTTNSTKESSYNINSQSIYIGLFRYVEYIANVHYKAPPNIMTDPKNAVTKPGSDSDLENGIKVGTLIGGCFRASNCTATLLGDFTVKCDYGSHIYIGGLAGYSNKTHGCRAVVEGRLKYSGSVPIVCVGGLQGLVYQEVTNCTSKVKSLVVEGGQTIYAGGLAGGIAFDNPKTTTRVVAGCATEIKHLLVDHPYGGVSYAGGLIGRNTAGIIYASYAVGAIGAGDTNQNHHYSGLVGQNENKNYQNMDYKIRIQNCYSAVGLPAGSENRNYNFCPTNPGTIQDCYYLTGTWRYGGKTYTALSNVNPCGTGTTYDQLKAASLPKCQYSYGYDSWGMRTTIWDFPVMTARETGYPFPVNTGNMLIRYGSGNLNAFTLLKKYEVTPLPYPGDDWPTKPD